MDYLVLLQSFPDFLEIPHVSCTDKPSNPVSELLPPSQQLVDCSICLNPPLGKYEPNCVFVFQDGSSPQEIQDAVLKQPRPKIQACILEKRVTFCNQVMGVPTSGKYKRRFQKLKGFRMPKVSCQGLYKCLQELQWPL